MLCSYGTERQCSDRYFAVNCEVALSEYGISQIGCMRKEKSGNAPAESVSRVKSGRKRENERGGSEKERERENGR